MATTDKKKTMDTPSAAPSNSSTDTYCPICGRDAANPSLNRFGEFFCSEAHVEEFAKDVRTKTATQAAATQAVTTTSPAPCCATDTKVGATQQKGRLGGFLKMAVCCGGMLLLLPALGLVSAGGLAAVAGSALSVVAALACPIGMYFMMRGMMKQGNQAAHGADATPEQKELAPKNPGPSA
jgi:hypothetical protein